MRSDEERLRDILESCDAIAQFLQSIDSLSAFMASRRDQNALLHELVIIGEASSHVSLEIQRANPNIPWVAIKNFRNIIVHNYGGVDLDIVWEVAKERIPLLSLDIRLILDGIVNNEAQ